MIDVQCNEIVISCHSLSGGIVAPVQTNKANEYEQCPDCNPCHTSVREIESSERRTACTAPDQHSDNNGETDNEPSDKILLNGVYSHT